VKAAAAEAEEHAADVRERIAVDPPLDPLTLFDHVFASPTPQLIAQRADLRAELEDH
jgi:2-oxoisovalerate dehydrogenase E1 component alpha subunit